MKVTKILMTLAISFPTAFVALSNAQARDLTVANFGGANGNAQEVAFIKPFEKATGQKVIVVPYTGEQAKVKAMTQSNNVVWDVVEIETGDLGQGCESGVYENDIDWESIVNAEDMVPGSLMHCGVGMTVWGTVLGYNSKLLKDKPTSWADFWDVTKFPGKRGLRKGAHYTLEIALMADGVDPADVYEVLSTDEGVNRAFKKLDELKPYILWWEAGAQPPQMLSAGDVSMSSIYNGRVKDIQDEGFPVEIIWNQSIADMEYWVIPAGSPNKDKAIEFIKFVSQPEAQAKYSENIAYGPISKSAIKLLSDDVLATLPNSPENGKNNLLNDLNFWTDYGEDLEQRFTAWSVN